MKRALGVLLVGWLAGACGSVTPITPITPSPRLMPTACEKRALMTGEAPEVASPEAVAESLRWGVLAPESCPEAAGRLSLGPDPSGRGR